MLRGVARSAVAACRRGAVRPGPLVMQQRRGVVSVETVGVVGLGLMGHGIAQTSAEAGLRVVAVENNEAALQAGQARIEDSVSKLLAKAVHKGRMEEGEAAARKEQTLANVEYTLDMGDVKNCDLVVEAIVEDIEVKKPFYANLTTIAKPDAILASNTSSLSIREMADAAGAARMDRFLGLHFFNPVQIMKLVELVVLEETDPVVAEAMRQWIIDIGKTPVVCKDRPGFIVNRLLVPNLAQALLLHERGDASIPDIDVAMRLGCGHPMGPFVLADYVGLDTTLSILEGWKKTHPEEPAFVVPEILRAMVASGKLGRKTGLGFYHWDGDKVGDFAG